MPKAGTAQARGRGRNIGKNGDDIEPGMGWGEPGGWGEAFLAKDGARIDTGDGFG